jgi:hypothetical protein
MVQSLRQSYEEVCTSYDIITWNTNFSWAEWSYVRNLEQLHTSCREASLDLAKLRIQKLRIEHNIDRFRRIKNISKSNRGLNKKLNTFWLIVDIYWNWLFCLLLIHVEVIPWILEFYIIICHPAQHSLISAQDNQDDYELTLSRRSHYLLHPFDDAYGKLLENILEGNNHYLNIWCSPVSIWKIDTTINNVIRPIIHYHLLRRGYAISGGGTRSFRDSLNSPPLLKHK